MRKAKRAPSRSRYVVAQDYATTDLDGKGGVAWSAGGVVELDSADAAWVNEQRPETLVVYAEAVDPGLDDESREG